jgi:type II secretory pathway component GspD/PulD (secretin)
MRFACSQFKVALGLLAAMAAAMPVLADPTISSWAITPTGQEEALSIQWDESGTYEVSRFAEARQLVVLIPGAVLHPSYAKNPLNVSNSPLFERARLQAVTLPNGAKGAQLTLQLREWAEPVITADDKALRLSFAVPEHLMPKEEAATVEPQTGLELTDEAVSQMLTGENFGAANAPASGAGQAPTTSVDDFYVPPASDGTAGPGVRSSQINDLALESKLNEMVTRVDFQGTSLENVLRLIAERSELNILIKPADVAGKLVTLRLRNVTLREMLDAILKMSDLGYTVEPGGIVNIVPRSKVTTEEVERELESISINWISAEEVVAILAPLTGRNQGSGGGESATRVSVSRSNNMVIVREEPERLRAIRDLIATIDRPEKQVLVELRLVNMSETAARAIGARTSFESQEAASQNQLIDNPRNPLFPYQSSTVNTASSGLSNSSSGTTSNSSSLNQSLTTIGRTLTSTVTGTASNTASSAAASTTANETVNIPNTGVGAGLLAPGANAFQLSQVGSIGIFGNDYDVRFALNAQEERGEAVTLANPTVLSLNNVEASVEIKRQIPYISAINSSDGSIGTVEFVDVGTKVDLLPRITNNGYVQMEVTPEQILNVGESGGVPVTDERRLTASVIVKDEQTISLGGLRQFESSASEEGVPYIMRLPILSWLFKSQANRMDKVELYLFVTPHIVKDPTPTAYQQALYEKIDYNWDLPDYYFDEIYARKSPGEEAPKDAK